MQVEPWMNREVVTIAPGDSFRTAMHLIRQQGIRRLPVVEGQRVVGIVTDRDIRQVAPSEATSLSIHESDILRPSSSSAARAHWTSRPA